MNAFVLDNLFQDASYRSTVFLSNRDKNFLSHHLTTRILSGTLNNANLGHSMLIYLAQLNIAHKFTL